MTSINKNERGLLVAVNLSTGGEPTLQKLYEWLDENAINVAKLILQPHYRFIETLSGDDTTSTNFVERVNNLALDPQIRALDVFLVFHGLKGSLYFDDGAVKSSDLGDRIRAANLGHRLRLLYSTACYGASHAPDFVRAGFRVASGAKGICANGPFDYPTQLYNWGKDKTYLATVKAGNHPAGLVTHDMIARALGFEDVDSEKIIAGKRYTRITSEAI